MGTYMEEKRVAGEESSRNLQTYSSCLWSFLSSISGGVILGWWEYEYHPTYSQLWMVPSGLILFVTPVIVWFAVVVSGTRYFKEDHSSETSHQLVVSIQSSVEENVKHVNAV